jgi:hypothetical protein
MRLSFSSPSRLSHVPGGADQISSYHPCGYLNLESSFQPDAGECYNEALSAVKGKIIFNRSAGPGTPMPAETSSEVLKARIRRALADNVYLVDKLTSYSRRPAGPKSFFGDSRNRDGSAHGADVPSMRAAASSPHRVEIILGMRCEETKLQRRVFSELWWPG